MISATTTTAASPGATYCVRNRIRRSQSMWKSVGISRSTIRRKAKRLPSRCVYPSACATPTYRRHDGTERLLSRPWRNLVANEPRGRRSRRLSAFMAGFGGKTEWKGGGLGKRGELGGGRML